MITFGLDLNLIPGKVLPRLNVSQYDKGQTVSVSLWNGDVPYSIPAGCTAQVVGTKADKTGFMYECTIANGQPSFVITDQMTVFPGEVTLEVIVMDADSRIGTVNFSLDVEKAALADDTQISESDMPIIQQLPEIRAEVEAAAAIAEAWAVGPGTEQEPSATNNAYYWAMQAASAAGGGLQPSVVQELPTQNISTSTIYFVPAADPSASNYYDEYINLDGTPQGWELIGTTAIDLTDYYTKGEVNALLATINGNVTTLDTQLKACSGQAAPYSTTKNYVPTDMVYYNDMLYQCIGAHTGAWDDLYFEPVDLSLLQTRYNNLNTQLTPQTVSVTANGSETYSQLLDRLFALIDVSKLTSKATLQLGNNSILNRSGANPSIIMFGGVEILSGQNTVRAEVVALKTSGSEYGNNIVTGGGTFNNLASNTASGTFTLTY